MSRWLPTTLRQRKNNLYASVKTIRESKKRIFSWATQDSNLGQHTQELELELSALTTRPLHSLDENMSKSNRTQCMQRKTNSASCGAIPVLVRDYCVYWQCASIGMLMKLWNIVEGQKNDLKKVGKKNKKSGGDRTGHLLVESATSADIAAERSTSALLITLDEIGE
jgi:hypothetical protein